MAALYTECLIAYNTIMNKNLDLFTWKGYDLHFLDKEGKKITEKKIQCVSAGFFLCPKPPSLK